MSALPRLDRLHPVAPVPTPAPDGSHEQDDAGDEHAAVPLETRSDQVVDELSVLIQALSTLGAIYRDLDAGLQRFALARARTDRDDRDDRDESAER